MKKPPNIVELSGSPEGRARMARWLEGQLDYPPGALDDGPRTPFEEMPDTPLKRLAIMCSAGREAAGPADFVYVPPTIDLASDGDED